MTFLYKLATNNFTVVYLLIANILLFGTSTNVYPQKPTVAPMNANCFMDPKLQKMRSIELAALVAADQKERVTLNKISNIKKINQNGIDQLNSNDLSRRKRVGEIMGEGCLKTAADYTAASIIYLHGDVPDHYYQAFIWANKASVLGDTEQKRLVAMSIDRYLVSIGKKQLFGSQFQASDTTNWCFCLQPVEPAFSDSDRVKYLQKKINVQYKFLLSLNKGNKHCTDIECPINLASSPQGSVPGFW